MREKEPGRQRTAEKQNKHPSKHEKCGGKYGDDRGMTTSPRNSCEGEEARRSPLRHHPPHLVGVAETLVGPEHYGIGGLVVQGGHVLSRRPPQHLLEWNKNPRDGRTKTRDSFRSDEAVMSCGVSLGYSRGVGVVCTNESSTKGKDHGQRYRENVLE